jgi:hypothetical protein
MTKTTPSFRIATLLLVGVLACGCSNRKFGEVEGTITLDGKPLDEAEVTFVPDSLKGNTGNNASAITDEQGRYRLRTERDRADGAILGPHRVIIVDLPVIPDLSHIGGAAPMPVGQVAKAGKPKARRFPARYESLEQTPLKAIEVKAGKQTLDFDVKSAGVK